MKAMILAAGKGTRLGELTAIIPKVLVDINGKSILQLAVEKCARAGFDEIIINVHHLAGMVVEEITRLGRLGYSLSISDETDGLLETGGGLYKARSFFDSQPFLLYNADILTELDLRELYNFHIERNALATLAVRNRPGNRFFLVNKEGVLRGWINKATGEKIITPGKEEKLNEIAFSGMHIIDPSIFDYMQDGVFTMTTLYLTLASSHHIQTFTHNEGYWFDIGTPEKLEEARRYLK